MSGCTVAARFQIVTKAMAWPVHCSQPGTCPAADTARPATITATRTAMPVPVVPGSGTGRSAGAGRAARSRPRPRAVPMVCRSPGFAA